jgi:hypothetical protein
MGRTGNLQRAHHFRRHLGAVEDEQQDWRFAVLHSELAA